MKITDPGMVDEYYEALLKRDREYLGLFVVGVTSTGICCLPTCRARKPKKENTEYFDSSAHALRAGYRPCKICRPTEGTETPPVEVRRALQLAEESPAGRVRDADLRELGIGPATVRRWCQRNLGLSFHGYHRMLRINAAYGAIAAGRTVTDVALESGYDSLSGFRDRYKAVTGHTPSGSGQLHFVQYRRLETPLGPMLAAADDTGLVLLEFSDRRMLETELNDIEHRLAAQLLPGDHEHLRTVERELAEYFAGQRQNFEVPLHLVGTEFQKSVWRVLLDIPYGETRSYRAQAQELGRPTAVRAVASANGYNHIAIVIPCHRVIGSNGHLTGYGGGLARKRWLLQLEGAL